jgi:hypothetical protein
MAWQYGSVAFSKANALPGYEKTPATSVSSANLFAVLS